MRRQIRNIFFLTLLVSFVSCTKNSGDNPPPPVPKDGLYKNGIFRTGIKTNSGVPAPIGYYWSEAQHTAGNNSVGNQLTGVACYISTGGAYRIADDFIVPTGQTWNVSSVFVYAFVDGNSSPVCPIDQLRIQIWKGKPSEPGATLVTGDMSTNVLSTAIDSLTYVISNSSVPAPGVAPVANSKIWKLTANIATSLPPGAYWLVWQVNPITGIAFSPVAKVVGVRGLPTWNSIVYNSLSVWQDVLDQGIPVTLPRLPQDMVFEIAYKY